MIDKAGEGASRWTGDDYVQPNLGHALRIWWAFYWPTTLISFPLVVILGYALRLLYENTLVPAKWIRLGSQIGGYVITYVVAIFVMRYVLRKTFRHFRIGLLSNIQAASKESLEVTFHRTLRVWWIYVWRTIVYFALAFVFVVYPAGMFVGLFRPSPTFTNLFFALLGFIVNAALSLFVIYANILDEEIGDFRVSLLPRATANAVGAAPVSNVSTVVS